MRYFFYGTLMDPDVRALVLRGSARAIRIEPATLPDYRRVYIRHRTYPVVVRDRSARVAGCLAHGLRAVDAARLADFEGREYEAAKRHVVTAADETVEAWVFVAGARAAPTTASWDLETWQQRHKASFRRRWKGSAD